MPDPKDRNLTYRLAVGVGFGIVVIMAVVPLVLLLGYGNRSVDKGGLMSRFNQGMVLAMPTREPLEGVPVQLYPVALRVEKPVVRGIHITSWVAGSTELLHSLLELTDATELNTAVIDLKESDGRIAYEADIPLARETGSVEKRIRDLDQIVHLLKEHHLYKIARIVVFKDTFLAEHRSDLALLSRSTGAVWRDFKGDAFSNPYNREVWDYNLELAIDAARRGFDEIQFDYIRFPSDGKLADIQYPPAHTEAEAMKVIQDFASAARARLAPYHVALSLDVFGLTTVRDDVGIGQNFKELSRIADTISPMIYPSHYWKGAYGFQNPNGAPYDIVHLALRDAVRKSSDETHPEALVRKKIRPWLQDFSLGAPSYGAEEVRRQIQATYDSGIEEWLLWNPRVHYTRAALLPTAPPPGVVLSDQGLYGDYGARNVSDGP